MTTANRKRRARARRGDRRAWARATSCALAAVGGAGVRVEVVPYDLKPSQGGMVAPGRRLLRAGWTPPARTWGGWYEEAAPVSAADAVAARLWCAECDLREAWPRLAEREIAALAARAAVADLRDALRAPAGAQGGKP